jgi:hypothetical protein
MYYYYYYFKIYIDSYMHANNGLAYTYAYTRHLSHIHATWTHARTHIIDSLTHMRIQGRAIRSLP